mmetsp:Transcript_26227/g.45121  ORF Transcript_26227/g.45121 Transcript_26227/m.45121 type:complete len:516 (+) Transcript_26227:90-1637(+)
MEKSRAVVILLLSFSALAAVQARDFPVTRVHALLLPDSERDVAIVDGNAEGKDLCGPCLAFASRSIDQVVKTIGEYGVQGGCNKLCSHFPSPAQEGLCEMICDYVGIQIFVDALKRSDLDPFYACELLKFCPIVDGGVAKIIDLSIDPASAEIGTQFLVSLKFEVTSQTGVGEVLAVITNEAGDKFGLAEPNEGFAPGGYAAQFPIDTSDPEQSFSAGAYTIEIFLCAGECGSKHPHSETYDTASTKFVLTGKAADDLKEPISTNLGDEEEDDSDVDDEGDEKAEGTSDEEEARDVDDGTRDVEGGPSDVEEGPRDAEEGPRGFDEGPRDDSVDVWDEEDGGADGDEDSDDDDAEEGDAHREAEEEEERENDEREEGEEEWHGRGRHHGHGHGHGPEHEENHPHPHHHGDHPHHHHGDAEHEQLNVHPIGRLHPGRLMGAPCVHDHLQGQSHHLHRVHVDPQGRRGRPLTHPDQDHVQEGAASESSPRLRGAEGGPVRHFGRFRPLNGPNMNVRA